jgi:nitrate reductase gamma subunit
MEPAPISSALHTAEIVHWIALGVMGLVYLIRLLWLFHFAAGRDRQHVGERGTKSLYPAFYSIMNVAMPWAMESTRKNFLFYLSFAVFHIGVAAGIFAAFVSTIYRPFLEIPFFNYSILGVIAAAFLIAFGRIIRRIARPVMRLISTPDDYFALFTLFIWFGIGVLCMAYIGGHIEGEGYLIAYLYATSFFLVYVPFSKISHYLYYPFTRYWRGKTLGHRGSMPAKRG